MASNDDIDNSLFADRGGRNIVNRPLPWVCLLAAALVWMTWTAAKAQSASEAANQRITDLIAAQTQIQTANSQTLNDIRNRAIDAEVQAQLLREHYDKIANDFAAKGFKLPALPKELKSAK